MSNNISNIAVKFKESLVCKIAQGIILAYLIMAVAGLALFGIARGVGALSQSNSTNHKQTVSYSVTNSHSYAGYDDITKESNGLY